MNTPPLLTYPARPIQGGRLELAPPKRGLWYAEPKLNGWRTLIHTPSGTMWNRHGTLLTIADCFRPALETLAALANHVLVWADCEALERRHTLGRGTLVVLDMVPGSGTPTYERRRAILESLIPTDAEFSGDTSRPVPSDAVALIPTLRAGSHADALAYYQRLRAANRAMGLRFLRGRGDEARGFRVPRATPVCDRGVSRVGEAPLGLKFNRAKSPKRLANTFSRRDRKSVV